MKVTVFKSHNKRDTYVFLAAGDPPSSLPSALRGSLGDLQPVLDLELTPTRRLARADAVQVLEAISRQGFYLQLPPDSEALMGNDRLTY